MPVAAAPAPCPRLQIMFAEEQVECRRVLLMQHFGEAFDPAQCRGTCDLCAAREVSPGRMRAEAAPGKGNGTVVDLAAIKDRVS